MPIYFHKEDIGFVLKNPLLLKKWIKTILANYKKNAGNLNFIFCSDNYLLELNQKHLNHDYFTDVITFDQSENAETVSGDIFISIERVKENAERNSFEDELHRVMIHGVLHLLGYSDKTPAKKRQMRALEDRCLEILISMN